MEMDYEHFDDPNTQRKWDASTMADWVNWLAPWQVISHLTFSWEASLDAGRKAYEKFMAKHLGRLSYFYALEQNPGRDGFHVHALWADAGTLFRKSAWSEWFNTYGRARIEPVRRYEDVSGYCAKYVTKEGSWWNVKLQWHRIEAMHKRPFRLETNLARRAEPASDQVSVADVATQIDPLPPGAQEWCAEVDHTLPVAAWNWDGNAGVWKCSFGGVAQPLAANQNAS